MKFEIVENQITPDFCHYYSTILQDNRFTMPITSEEITKLFTDVASKTGHHISCEKEILILAYASEYYEMLLRDLVLEKQAKGRLNQTRNE